MQMRSGIEHFVEQTLHTFEFDYPNPSTELAPDNPYQLLVATIFSAQSTDKRVRKATLKRCPRNI